jgi:hypothetical protein
MHAESRDLIAQRVDGLVDQVAGDAHDRAIGTLFDDHLEVRRRRHVRGVTRRYHGHACDC